MRRSLLAAIAFLLLTALLSTAPVAAHTSTRNDGNDSPSKIDLKAVSVSHTPTGVVHKVQTHNSWTPASLQHDSFFLIGINKDDDARYERCAFIYFTSRLRGQLSNCGSQFISFLPVAKLNGTTAKITIPKAQLGPAYKWFGRSLWIGAAPCRNGCNDFAPNTFPDILHDLTAPTITMLTDPLSIWIDSTSSSFTFPFAVDDAHSAVESWTVESRAVGTTAWTQESSGSGAGSPDPTVVGEPGRWTYRVVAEDIQGNLRTRSRSVLVPLDETSIDPGAFEGTPSNVSDAQAYGGAYAGLDAGESFSLTADASSECRFDLIGPGGGDWVVNVLVNGVFFDGIGENEIVDGPRKTIVSMACTDGDVITVAVISGTGFGIDGIVPPV